MFKLPALLFLLSLTGITVSEPWTSSVHPWGDPDLQGTWTNATVTRLERSDTHSQLILSDSEVIAVELDAVGFQEDNDALPDGDLEAGVGVGGYNSAWIDPGTRVLRVDGQPRSSIIVEPADGKLPYKFSGRFDFFKELLKTQLRNNPEEQLLGDRCMVGFGSSGGPPMLPVLYNNNYQIVQSPGHVMIMIEMNHSHQWRCAARVYNPLARRFSWTLGRRYTRCKNTGISSSAKFASRDQTSTADEHEQRGDGTIHSHQ
jgi:hypothetical protein